MERGALGTATHRQRATLAAALTALSIASLSTPARADYCRTKACDAHLGYEDVWQTEPDGSCAETMIGCRLEGKPLYWPKSCLSFAVQQDGSKKRGIRYETLHDIVEQTFATWMNADCGGGAPPSLRVDDLGSAVCNQPEYNTDQGNANVFMFRDGDWPHKGDFATLALTTVTYNTETAEILDADVEINSYLYDFSTPDNPHDEYDLLTVLTHETGHFLGLSHDTDGRATMYAWYLAEQVNLFESDVRGMCDMFPPGQGVSGKACVPRHGYARTCAVDDGGCAISREGARGTRAVGVFALLGLSLALRRRRVRRGACR